MHLKNFLIALILLMLSVHALYGQQTVKEDRLLAILEDELEHNITALNKLGTSVYLMSYRVEEVNQYNVKSTFGMLNYATHNPKVTLTIQIRVGSYELDNWHELRDDYSDYGNYSRSISLPINNDSILIRQIIWIETEKAYREALKRIEKVKANVAVKAESEDKSPDYSAITPSIYFEPRNTNQDFSLEEWSAFLKNVSLQFSENRDIINGYALLNYYTTRQYFVSIEGSSIVQNNQHAHLYLQVAGQAEDGMQLPLVKSYYAHYPSDLPKQEILLQDAKQLNNTLSSLIKAPVADSYTGPALLSNEVAGVFFHEIFGHRVEGSRMKKESDGQTFKKKINELILSPNINVIFDPTLSFYGNIPLNGNYQYDDEGVKSQRVMVVEQGVLKNFLMTRTPIDQFPNSNGHARAQAGLQPVSRQSNLIVETTQSFTDQQLRAMLIEEAKAQGKTYGYYFAKVLGGFTTTGRYYPNSFNVTPIEVYRVYVDGRPDELVRGVDLVGTPLSIFSKIEAVGNSYANFAGACGAESGSVPVGCCSPALFVKQIETQKKGKSQSKPPISERPLSYISTDDYFSDIAFNAMKDIINYNFNNLVIDKLQSPYYMSYLITNARFCTVECSLGGIITSKEEPLRSNESTILVGNNKLNNLNFFNENTLYGSSSGNFLAIPLDNNYNGIRQSLWLSSDKNYKSVAEQFESKKAVIKQQKIDSVLLSLPDFSPIPPSKVILDDEHQPFIHSHIENCAQELSKFFLPYSFLTNSGVNIYAYYAEAIYLNSEGIQYKQPFPIICLQVYAQTTADDGEPLTDCKNIYVKYYEQLPSMDELQVVVTNMANQLDQLRHAPAVTEDYSGPVLFVGDAAGTIVAKAFVDHENGLLAGRNPISNNPSLLRMYKNFIPIGNKYENSIGKKVITRAWSVSAVDQLTEFNSIPLIGSYLVDAQGVATQQRLPLITNGVLQTLLSDRIPTPSSEKSNGHRRLALSGSQLTTSLCAGVIEINTTDKMNFEKLKKQLIAIAKEEDYDYAYIITKIADYQMAAIPDIQKYLKDENLFIPIYAYQISVKDGSTKLVRMTKLPVLNLNNFKNVVAVSNIQQVYNTMLKGNKKNELYFNSELKISGVPCSFIIPDAILFQQLEIEKDKEIMLKKEPFTVNPMTR